MDVGEEVEASTGWGHKLWTPVRAIGSTVDGWGETLAGAVEAMFEESLRQGQGRDRGLQFGPDLGPLDEYGAILAAGGEVMADGNVPMLSNGAGCLLGDTSDCVWFTVEVVIDTAGGFVAGRVVSVVGRVGKTIFVRITSRNGGHAIVPLTDDAVEGIQRTADGKSVDLTAELADDIAAATANNVTPAPTAATGMPGRSVDAVTPSRTVGDANPSTKPSSSSGGVVDGGRLPDGRVDLASPARRRHILDGDATGGGHRWPGTSPDKTPFPREWSDDDIMHAISDIATDSTLEPRNVTGAPGSLKTKAGNPARHEIFGYRDGVCIRVIHEPLGDGIITGHPIVGPCPS